jgi:hypothetical protein
MLWVEGGLSELLYHRVKGVEPVSAFQRGVQAFYNKLGGKDGGGIPSAVKEAFRSSGGMCLRYL